MSGVSVPTAMSVLDRLGATLRDGHPALIRRSVDYDGLTDSMFHVIRQNAAGSAARLMRMLEVLAAIAGCERDPARLAALQRHAVHMLGDAERDISTPAAIEDLSAGYRHFALLRENGPLAHIVP